MYPPSDEPTPEAQARATASAERITEKTGLTDDPEVFDAVQGWFARWDEQIQAMDRGEGDGCPCYECDQERAARAQAEQI